MHKHLQSLCNGHSLSRADSQSLFKAIINNEIDPALMAGLLIALKIKGETAAEISGAALALRQSARPFPRPQGTIADIVGTGGDGLNTINVSSTSVFVAAAAGVKVCKHGNRSVSSKSGSADVLQAMGINIDMTASQARATLDACNACFIFAPQYHPGFKHALKVRKALKTRTIFNILGPLINPAAPNVMLLGVYSKQLLTPIAHVLPTLGVQRAMVVHGSGMDEICLHGPTDVIEVNNETFEQYQLNPNQLGLHAATIADIAGASPEQNASISKKILAGQASRAHTDLIAANAGALIYLAGCATTLKQGVAKAKHIIKSATALNGLNELARSSYA